MMGRFVTEALLVALLLVPTTLSVPTPPRDYRWAREEAVGRWHDLKFGLRIHWGLYAIDALGPESWPLTKGNLTFMRDYWARARQWRPARFDAQGWIALMRRSGVKFFDFTTKHHEGFSMFDTDALLHDCWDLNGTAAAIVGCPANFTFSSQQMFGRDVVGELVAAARAGGVLPGLYFSHIDWFDPDMRIDQWNAVACRYCRSQPCDPARYSATSNATQWERFVLRHRTQVAEVLTKYGDILELSLDMEFPAAFDSAMQETIMLARQLAPNTLLRGRGIGGTREQGGMGDYNTPEEQFPAEPIPGNWQVIYHGSAFMSYDPDPSHYVNGSFIVWHLVDIVSKGGLMQIGYGPDRDGEFHPLAVQALEFTGRWLDVNGEAIFSTRPFPRHWNDTASDQVRYTRAKDNSTLYATALGLPSGSILSLACVSARPGSNVTLLGWIDPFTRQPLPLVWKPRLGGGVDITVPDGARHTLLGPGYSFRITGAPLDSC